MTTDRSALHCSDACEKVMVVRSFGRCPECGLTWDGRQTGAESHYRNNAWQICETCARRQHRCVVCGASTADRESPASK
jgi:hypothetical protein